MNSTDNTETGGKFYIEATIDLHEETQVMREKASKVIKLPEGSEKQPDLLYLSAIFVSTGTNLNNAHFLGSELVAAEKTIANKALDIEHIEDEIIGHLYDRAFIDLEGNLLDVKDLASKEVASVDAQNMHVAVAGVIYKNRFPSIAQEVADNKYKVSMECYYQNYDVKIGDVILPLKDAEVMGLTSISSSIGKKAKIMKGGKEIASGTVGRVLRGICFSGCGIVKNPANPPSVILETASSDEVIILNYDNKVTYSKIDPNIEKSNSIEEPNLEVSAEGIDDNVGICVNYKKSMLDKDNNVTAVDWCTAYDTTCTSFGRYATDSSCLRRIALEQMTTACVKKIIDKRNANNNTEQLLNDLKAALREAAKVKSRL